MQQTHARNTMAMTTSILQLVLLAAIFGFFYAYSVTVMWGLDLVRPATAIEAMNGINTAVRNPAFAPAFFGPVVVGVIAGFAIWRSGNRTAAMVLLASWAIYLVGCLVLTAQINVPMNRAMLATGIPADPLVAHEMWSAYSVRWTFFNHLRLGFAGLSFAVALFGFYLMVAQRVPANQQPLRPASPATLQSWNLPLL